MLELQDFFSCGKLKQSSTDHIAVQSKCTMSHLLGLNAMESANSIPFIHLRSSGQTKAEPA